jgi:hypothetical protein
VKFGNAPKSFFVAEQKMWKHSKLFLAQPSWKYTLTNPKIRTQMLTSCIYCTYMNHNQVAFFTRNNLEKSLFLRKKLGFVQMFFFKIGSSFFRSCWILFCSILFFVPLSGTIYLGM